MTNKSCFLILNYNSKDDVIRLVSYLKNFYDDYIVVVDNCSSNNDFNYLRENLNQFENVFVLKSEKNGGYAYGNNYGIIYIINNLQCDYIFIANPDIEVDENTIKEMLKIMSSDKRIGIVAPKMITNDKNNISAWKLPTMWDDIIMSFGILNKILKIPVKYENEIYLSNKFQYVDVVQGAFFLLRKEAIIKCGFFDEDTFLYGEERILAYKMKKNNFKVIFLPYISFYHYVSKSVNDTFSSLKKYKLLQNSRLIYHKKYMTKNKYLIAIYSIIIKLGYLERLFFYTLKKFLKGTK
jgi:GT2 family glycosyltransferase